MSRPLLNIPPDQKVRIKGQLYHTAQRPPRKGEYVLDRGDGSYAEVEETDGKHLTLRDGHVVEGLVPVDRVYALDKI